MGANLWDYEKPIRDYLPETEIPAWLDQDISPCDVASIVQGGCASGAYMPAVTYHTATATMNEHGDDVLQYVEENLGELPQPKTGESWSGLAVFYLSAAVELWASGAENWLSEELPEKAE